MSRRETTDYKIEAAQDMLVGALPPLDQHPGKFVRDVLLPEYGLNVSSTARAISMDRATLHLVLSGQKDVSRDLAYKLGALMRDEVADFLIAFQHQVDLERERERREQFRKTITRLPEPAEDVQS